MNDEQNAHPQIQTFVFFDLETTGFNDKPRILELSMIAVSRSDLLYMKESHLNFENTLHTIPRVINKYTQLYYPKKLITPLLEEITGLSNYNLSHLPSFQADNATGINLFIKHLPSPVCLVAHNGLSFDFPILKAELLNVNEDDMNGILCADSLIFVRKFEEDDIKQIAKLAENFQDSDFEDIILQTDQQNGYSPTQQNGNYSPATQQNGYSPITQQNGNSSNLGKIYSEVLNDSPSCSSTNLVIPNSDIINNMYKTPKKSMLLNSITTPPRFQKNDLSSQNERTPEHKFTQNEVNNSKVKRALYHNANTNIWKKPFSQPTLYHRIFGQNYKAHCAEGDATALMQICAFHGQEFLSWVDHNFTTFQAVKPRWSVRKSFTIN